MKTWISAEEKKPKKYKDVLVSDGEGYAVRYFDGEEWGVSGCFRAHSEGVAAETDFDEEIKFWMDIPELK